MFEVITDHLVCPMNGDRLSGKGPTMVLECDIDERGEDDQCGGANDNVHRSNLAGRPNEIIRITAEKRAFFQNAVKPRPFQHVANVRNITGI
jgi:hypothetical protein